MLLDSRTCLLFCLLSLLWLHEARCVEEGAEPRAQNLLKNADFESCAIGSAWAGGPADGWWKPYGSRAVLEVVEEARPGSPGKQCLKIGTNEKVKAGGMYAELAPVNPKKALIVSGWLKPGRKETQLRGLYFGIGWYDEARQPIVIRKGTKMNYFYLYEREQHGKWYRMHAVVLPADKAKETYGREIPPNAAFFSVRVFTLNYPCPAWFDDIEAYQMPVEKAKAMKQVKPAPAATTTVIDTDWVVAWIGGREAKEAAEEMKRYAERVIGQKVLAVPWRPNKAKHVFVVTEAKQAPPEIKAQLEGKRRDAFSIQYPVRHDGQDVCMLVSHDEHAHDYPVYYFLTKFMDVHWVGPGELGVVLEPQPEWRMPDKIDVLENPDFEMRLWSGTSFRSREWLARSGRMGFHHALGHVFHPKKHGDKPDVYPLVGGKRYIPDLRRGKRALSGWQPCTGNPRSVDIAVEYVLDGLRDSRRGAISMSLSVNDGAGNICMCPLCLTQDAKDAFQEGERPNLSDRLFRFYNTVMERVLEENPEAYIAVLGYGACKTPPQEFKVHPRIQVFHVQPSVDALKAWKAAGATPNMYMWLWDGGFLTIRPDLMMVAQIVRECRAMGGLGFYSEIMPHWAISAPKYYVLAGLLWDTTRSVDELLDKYCRLAYGPAAAPAMRSFYERWYEIYNRRPADVRHETAWGWRKMDQFEHLRRSDLTALDAAIGRALAAEATAKEKERMGYVATYYQVLRINAEEYLVGREMGDREWLASRTPEQILSLAESTISLTDEFNRLWRERVEGDRSGWLLDERYHKKPESYWDRAVGQLRTMVSSAHETAVGNAIAFLNERQLAKEPKDRVIGYWEAQMEKRPGLAAYIGPQVNKLKGVEPPNAVANGSFEEGKPGDPPSLEGWDFYESYGMVKGVKAHYSWESGSGRADGKAIGFGEGRYPEMKAIIQMEGGHRYALSFWYRTEHRDRDASFWLFTYDGQLSSPRDIDNEKISRFVRIGLEPTEGEWRNVTRTITAPRSGTYIIQLAVYYQKKGWWAWFDDVEIRKIW